MEAQSAMTGLPFLFSLTVVKDRTSLAGWLLLAGLFLSILPKMNVPEVQNKKRIPFWLKVVVALAQVLIAAGAVVGVWMNYGTLRISQTQTKLLYDQIIGANAARCYEAFDIEDDAPNSLKISIGNDGKSGTRFVKGHYTIRVEKGWPNGETISEQHVDVGPFVGLRDKDGARDATFRVPGLNFTEIKQRHQTVVVYGYLSYEDGFGNWLTPTVCQRILGAPPKPSSGLGKPNCDKLDYTVNMWLRLERDAGISSKH